MASENSVGSAGPDPIVDQDPFEATKPQEEPAPAPEPAKATFLTLSLIRKEFLVVIPAEMTLNQQERRLKLVEMNETEKDGWANKQVAKIKYDGKGQPAGITDTTDIRAQLVALCLRDESGKPVPLQTIRQFPTSTVDALADKCEEMNCLTKEARDAAKKSH